jgi:hypothetical protein
MSHAEYCAKLDEDQLDSLIKHANACKESLKAKGWVKVWVVADYCNRAWYPLDQHEQAMDKMIELARTEAKSDRGCEWSVKIDRMRPSEAAELFKNN